MSLVGNTKGSLPYYTVAAALQTAAQVATVEDLQKLSPSAQADYVEARGTGSPPALLLPSADGKGESLASLAPSKAAVDVTPAPTDLLSFLAQTPTGVAGDTPSAAAFKAWDVRLQDFYFDQKASGSPPALFLPDGKGQALLTASPSGSLRVYAEPDQFWANLYGATFNGRQPQSPTARADFKALDPDSQAYYFAQKAAGSPPALALADGTRQALALPAPGGGFDVSTPSDQFWADLGGKDYGTAAPQGQPAALDFQSWGPSLQAYYVARKGTGSPPTVLLQGGSADSYALASLGSDGRASVAPAAQAAGFAANLSAAATGTAYDSATLEQFTAWPDAYRAFYLAAKGQGTLAFASTATPTPDGARQATLSSGGAVVLSPVQPVPTQWDTTTSAPSAASIRGQAQSLTADAFSTWPFQSQINYLQTNGAGAPPALLLPTAAGGQALVSVAPGSNVVEITAAPADLSAELRAPSPAGALTLAQFEALPSDAARAAYLAARPDAVGSDTFNGWTSDRQTAYLALNVDEVTLAQFQSWPAQFQAYYLANKGTGAPPSLVLAGFGASVVASLSGDGASVQLTATSAKLAADASVIGLATPLDPATFFSLTPDEQVRYADQQKKAKSDAFAAAVLAAAGAYPPKAAVPPQGADALDVVTLAGASAGYTLVSVPLGGSLVVIALPTSTGSSAGGGPVQTDYSAFAAGSATATDFASWPPQVQSAYVLQQSAQALPKIPDATYPKVAVLKGDTVVVVPSPGAAAGIVPDPQAGQVPNPPPATASFKAAYGGTAPAPTDFLLWPYAWQLAWLRKQPAQPVTLGTDPNAMAVALGADGSGFQVAMTSDLQAYAKSLGHADPKVPLTAAERSAVAANIDFGLFSKVASPLLQAKLLATLADANSSPPIITLTKSAVPAMKMPTVISGGTAATGGGYTVEAVSPADYLGRDPAKLAPADFMAWSPAVRESYVLSRVKAPLPGTAAAGAPGTVAPPFYVGSGANVVAITFSAADGTLQVAIPQTLGTTVVPGATATALAGTLLPYDYLPGSAVGTSSPINDAVSAALYPILDGSGGAHNIAMSAQQKLDFAKAPGDLSGSTFTGWPTALQLQYLRVWQDPGAPRTIGTGADAIDAFMQTNAAAGTVPKVYVVQNLQKADIGMMAYADQATLARSAAFQTLASGLGLIPDCATAAAMATGTTAPLVGSTVTVKGVTIGGDYPDPKAGLRTDTAAGLVGAATPEQLKGSTLSAFGYVQTMFVTALNTIDFPTQTSPAPGLPDGNMPAADRKVFEDEVNLLRKQTFGSPLPTSQQNQSGGQAIFSPKDIQDKLTAIIQRFTRANAFSSVANSRTATAGYFQIQNMTGADPSKYDSRLMYVYNPDGKTQFTVEDDLGYYLLGDDRYRVPDRTTAYPDPQDYFQSRVASAFSSSVAALPTENGVPFTLSGLNLTLSTKNHDNGQDSNGNYPAGDSMTIDTMTIQRIDGSVKDNYIEEKEYDGSNSPSKKKVYNTFSLNGVTYEIMSMSGSKLALPSGVPSTFSSLAASTFESNYHPYTTNLSGFEGTYGVGDDGKAILDYVDTLIAGSSIDYKDGKPHTIQIADPSFVPDPTSTVQPPASTRPGSKLTVGSFNVYNVTIRYVPAAASVDSNATIDSGYQTFMAQEKSVLDLANRADQLANAGRVGGTQQNLDVPSLVYLFMMYTNLTGEAVLRADTEEVNQTNAVLNEYAIMQKIINQTVAAIKPGDNGQAGSGSLRGSNPDGSFTAQDMGALAMFTHGNSTAGTGNAVGQNPPLSPIELLQNGFTRPYLSHGIDYNQSSTQWSSDGTSLSDAVTQLNQVSQLKMNDINSETKQKDREFDLANTALQKMSDIVNKIAATI